MITMIIMVLAGGKGTLVGPVVGAVIVVFLEEYLRDFKDLRFSIFGLIVIAVVIFLPRGLMGFVARRREVYSPTDDGNIGKAVRDEPDLKGRALGQQGGMLDA
jgi:branched-chain amino acid transport system permease protein